jgi:LysR family transcriptional regulator, nitrogen assimilation regulatory protein
MRADLGGTFSIGMNLKQIEYFVSVAERGSFSQAARALGVAQPALSRQVRLLETDLREALLLRNGRGVALTEAGQRLLEHGHALLQQMAQVRADMGASRGEPAGRITLALPPTIGRQLTLPLIEVFQREFPKARLAVVEGLSAHIAEWIASGRVDIGLLYNPEAQPALELTPVLEEPLCLVSRAQGRGAQRRALAPLPLRELTAYPLVLPERAHAFRRLLDNQATRAGVKLQVAWEVSSIPAIIDLVCAGHGHAVLGAGAVAASGRAAELAVRPLCEPHLVSVLCLAVSASKRATPLGRELAQRLTALALEHVAPPSRPKKRSVR